MRKHKKGFTIVELVIVIAVIAILAAVLIPTFSSLIKKSNLNADMQAVREMNLALEADEILHGKPKDVETAMQVLANAGYNSENWVCITEGYEVYWSQRDNRMALYNAGTGEIEYPDQYDKEDFLDESLKWQLYNNNFKKAATYDISLGSAAAGTSGTQLSSGNASEIATNLSGNSETAKTALTSVVTTLTGNTATSSSVKTALGMASNATPYIYAAKEHKSSTTASVYATMQVAAVGASATPVLKSNGDVRENLFYISIVAPANPSPAELASAQAAAGEYIYTIFTQINTGKIDTSLGGVSIIIPAGTTIDVSANEWAPVKSFEGYFGTDNAGQPIVIDGARLTSATGYSQTVNFTGSSSKYFVTGFFGTVYGNTTIENVKFRNITIDEPATDYKLTPQETADGKTKNRNCVGIIGGITENARNQEANVHLTNIVVEDSVNILSTGTAGGLVGYIGAATGPNHVPGKVTIEGCTVSSKVDSSYTDAFETGGYGPVGGLVGLMCRVEPTLELVIKDTTFNGSVNGYNMIGSAVGDANNPCKITIINSEFKNAKLDTLHHAAYVAGAVYGSSSTVVTTDATTTIPAGLTAFLNSNNRGAALNR